MSDQCAQKMDDIIEGGIQKMNSLSRFPKVHYASRDRTNESTMQEVWYKTACGLVNTESPLTDDVKEVTCKNCLKRIKKWIR